MKSLKSAVIAAQDARDLIKENVKDALILTENLNSAQELSPRELTLAREWILDCQWLDVEGEEDVYLLTDRQVERGIKKHYGGGIAEFKRNCQE